MKISSTSNNDKARLEFVENLYKNLRKETQSALNYRNKLLSKANNYLDDGVTEEECVELLVIDGVERNIAERYVQLAQNSALKGGQYRYSFQFEDVYGKLWSSYDIGKEIYASNEEDAWEKAEEAILSDTSIEPERVVSIDRIS
jgi:hypothetical protein